MHNVWLISNPHSGSTSAEKCEAVAALFAEPHARIVGRTDFPEQDLPEPEAMTRAGADMVALFAGDGTINAAAAKYDRWPGAMLILPGGTMNMLAKRLHGEAEPTDIVVAAMEGHDTTRLPVVESGEHRAFVALILGPAAAWGGAREAVRYGRWRDALKRGRLAWARTWGRGIVVEDEVRRRGRHRAAVFVPGSGRMEVTAIPADSWGEVGRLGWAYLFGDVRRLPEVVDSVTAHARVLGPRAIDALFDGEAAKLPSPVEVRAGMSRLRFVTTLRETGLERSALRA